MSSAPRLAIRTLFLGTLFFLGALTEFQPARGEEGIRPAHLEDTARPAPAAANSTVHETAHETAHACLDQRERHAEMGKVIPLSAAMRTARARMPGTVVRARLCRGSEGLVYVLTVLARDGKVARLTVDAVKGTLVGGL